uniref:Uncharacterized protein n=1 Tax=Moniliophthora roreri TaxID=221103 RepID=A0A0W0F079_MONRR
MLKEHLQKI